MIGVCGCAYQETQNFDPQQDDIEEEDLLAEMRDMVLVEKHLARREEWFPDATNCTCCKGFKHGCKNSICKSLAVCRCSMDAEAKGDAFSIDDAIAYSQKYNGFPKTQHEIDMIHDDKQRMLADKIRRGVQKLVAFLEIDEQRETVSPSASLLLQLVEEHPENIGIVCTFFKDNLLGTIISGERQRVFTSCLLKFVFQKMRKDKDRASLYVSIPLYLQSSKLFKKLEQFFKNRHAAILHRSSPPESKDASIVDIDDLNSFMKAVEAEFPVVLPDCFKQSSNEPPPGV